MRILGYLLIVLGTIDWGVSLIGVDFYAIFGIYLKGLAYQYSPFIAGTLGGLLVFISASKSAAEDYQSSTPKFLEADENLILQKTVNGRTTGIGFKEPGFLYVTNKRVKFIGVSIFGVKATGELDFECELAQISSLKGTSIKLEIQYNDEIFVCAPGLFKAKSIIAELEKLRQ